MGIVIVLIFGILAAVFIWSVLRKNRIEAEEAGHSKDEAKIIKKHLSDDGAKHIQNVYVDFKDQNIYRKELLTPFEKVPFSDVISYQIVSDADTKHKHHGITRAIVGSALAGGVGAVVGAITGGKDITKFNKLAILINIS
ncbi:hypothetical protein M3M39_05790 [Fructilactobacillus hinvesii]|uniref:Uncharacterized protein n=1 Tax=Fructilactobacillus hinvesii TaxID=2940300 RepID=A0ABY5BT67_9LACO|nr:hypothetical protein [Fructilactobacillus hinvesii]USS87632.1 hypothetical protein M3M39_05790 [Fructilactobacillus hinvesii]